MILIKNLFASFSQAIPLVVRLRVLRIFQLDDSCALCRPQVVLYKRTLGFKSHFFSQLFCRMPVVANNLYEF